ncbi:hypothetical protein [Pseudonocardia humida]|uniref:Syndecan 1 n=1 Tax=Pseudonocardia humida TaxID=2800819 RepID=A0ABT1A6W9_9PSEU|nr:hypothetical protein [Pseudonocardia humida]MCO1658765.1 hypothetical protein [Pseudonocardia humida]
MIRGPEPLDPRPRSTEDPLPPAREQLPLPRRRQQAHLEPQLRERGGAGDGTPFSAFAAPTATEDQAAEPTGPTAFSSRLGQALQRGPGGLADRPVERSGVPGEPEAAVPADPAERVVRPERAADRAAAFRAATRRGRRPGQHPRRPRT